MSGLEASSEPSMEEILASIRKIIAEDSDGAPRARDASANAAPAGQFARQNASDDDDGMDLPSILRSSAAAVPERAAPLFNRLADVLRGNPAPPPAAPARGLDAERSLEDDLSDLLDGPPPPRSPAPARPAAMPVAPASAETGSMAMSGFAVNIPQAQRLLASLDESLAQWSDPNWGREPPPGAPSDPFSLAELAPPAPRETPAADAGPVKTVEAEWTAPAAAGQADFSPPPRREPAPLGDKLAVISPALPPVSDGNARPPPVLAELKTGTPLAPLGAKPVETKPASKPASKPTLQPVAGAKSPPRPSSEAKSAAVKPAGETATGGQPQAGPAGEASVISATDLFINGVTAGQAAGRSASAGGRTLDDAVAELLRPILRQWVSENLPQLVETMLRSEIAAAAREAVIAPVNGKNAAKAQASK